MAIDINIRITLAAGEQYTPYENGILAAVAGGVSPTLTADTPVKGIKLPEMKSEEAPVPAAEEAAPAPKRTRRTKAQIEADEKAAAEAEAAAAEAEEEAAALPEEAEPEADPLAALEADMDDADNSLPLTTADAVAKATEVLAAGGTAQVKAALATAGVKRVSELKGAAIAAFIAELEA